MNQQPNAAPGRLVQGLGASQPLTITSQLVLLVSQITTGKVDIDATWGSLALFQWAG